ncbi:MAG: hypothetical protein Q9171_002591 [Xanthocarpia ochracea]
MPRPKRTKLAPSVPIIPIAIASRKPQNIPDVSPALSSSRGTNGSDDSDGIVSKSKTGANRRGIAPRPAVMSGALAVEDAGTQKPRPLSTRKRIELSRIARDGDYAKANEALGKPGTTNVGTGTSVRTAEHAAIRMQLTHTASALSKTVAPKELSKTKAATLREDSVLAPENFRRRPRQPSILQIAQAYNAATEAESDHTLDDFNPDDESTLFRAPRADHYQEYSSISSRQSSSRKRKLSTPEIQVPPSRRQPPPNPSSSPRPSQSDNLTEVIAEYLQPNPSLPKIPARTSPPPMPLDSDTMAPPQSSSYPPSPQKLQRNPQTKHRTKKGRTSSKTNLVPTNSNFHDQSSPTLPPCSLIATQSSPTTAPQSRSPLKPLTTSALQSLLPRRRRLVSSNTKETTVFDLNTSSEIDSFNGDGDEDELNYPPTTKAACKPRTDQVKRNGTIGKGGKKGKMDTNPIGMKQQGRRQGKKGGQRSSMTYTRKPRTAEIVNANEGNRSGDESGGDEHHSDGAPLLTDGKARQEMKRLAAKFREVDDWGLEFEEVTGSSDRMRDAR